MYIWVDDVCQYFVILNQLGSKWKANYKNQKKENETKVNLKSASFVVIVLLHEGLFSEPRERELISPDFEL